MWSMRLKLVGLVNTEMCAHYIDYIDSCMLMTCPWCFVLLIAGLIVSRGMELDHLTVCSWGIALELEVLVKFHHLVPLLCGDFLSGGLDLPLTLLCSEVVEFGLHEDCRQLQVCIQNTHQLSTSRLSSPFTATGKGVSPTRFAGQEYMETPGYWAIVYGDTAW